MDYRGTQSKPSKFQAQWILIEFSYLSVWRKQDIIKAFSDVSELRFLHSMPPWEWAATKHKEMKQKTWESQKRHWIQEKLRTLVQLLVLRTWGWDEAGGRLEGERDSTRRPPWTACRSQRHDKAVGMWPWRTHLRVMLVIFSVEKEKDVFFFTARIILA